MTLARAIEKIKQELDLYYSVHEIWVFIHEIFRTLMNLDKAQIHAHPELEIPPSTWKHVRSILRDLKSYKPIQYILGHVTFYSLKINVNPSVLIPRPETEELVSIVIEENKNRQDINIIDIGTGSGCIAIALAHHLPQAQVFATDLKKEALATAKINAQLNNVRIKFQLHDIIATYSPVFDGQQPTYDIIVSNPPYVLPGQKKHMSRTVLDYEPEDALFVPENEPLIFYEAICYFASHNLRPGGKVYCEINEDMASEMIKMFERRGIENFSIYHDLNGKNRVVRVDF